MTPLQWQTSPSGTMTAQAFGFDYEIERLPRDTFSDVAGQSIVFRLLIGTGPECCHPEFESLYESHAKGVAQYHSDAVAKAIDEAMEGRWISVEEGLPAYTETILVAVDNCVYAGNMNNYGGKDAWKFAFGNTCTLEKGMVWRPLPKPPTKETK